MAARSTVSVLAYGSPTPSTSLWCPTHPSCTASKDCSRDAGRGRSQRAPDRIHYRTKEPCAGRAIRQGRRPEAHGSGGGSPVGTEQKKNSEWQRQPPQIGKQV